MHKPLPVRIPFPQWSLLSSHLNWIGEWDDPDDNILSIKKNPHYGAIWIQKGHVELRSRAQTIEAEAGECLSVIFAFFVVKETITTEITEVTEKGG
jgi:hypothetical protein